MTNNVLNDIQSISRDLEHLIQEKGIHTLPLVEKIIARCALLKGQIEPLSPGEREEIRDSFEHMRRLLDTCIQTLSLQKEVEEEKLRKQGQESKGHQAYLKSVSKGLL